MEEYCMKRLLVLFLAVCVSMAAFAGGGSQSSGSSGGAAAAPQEIRVLLANHPYGELLKPLIPEFEKSTGIKVTVESLQESQLPRN
jgi:multiple sugar transport system substrate-binding protein